MNSSQRFASLLWESPSLISSISSISLCLHVLASTLSPFAKLVDPLYQKYPVTSFCMIYTFSLLVDIGCPVSCKFPHGTLHYQSHKLRLLVGGSTLFNPHFMYGFISIRFYHSYGFLIISFLSMISLFLLNAFNLPSFSFLSYWLNPFCMFTYILQFFPISLATTFGLSVDYFILVLRCFNSQLVITFLRMLLHLWNPTLLQTLMFLHFSVRFSFPISTSNFFMLAYRSV